MSFAAEAVLLSSSTPPPPAAIEKKMKKSRRAISHPRSPQQSAPQSECKESEEARRLASSSESEWETSCDLRPVGGPRRVSKQSEILHAVIAVGGAVLVGGLAVAGALTLRSDATPQRKGAVVALFKSCAIGLFAGATIGAALNKYKRQHVLQTINSELRRYMSRHALGKEDEEFFGKDVSFLSTGAKELVDQAMQLEGPARKERLEQARDLAEKEYVLPGGTRWHRYLPIGEYGVAGALVGAASLGLLAQRNVSHAVAMVASSPLVM